MVFAKFFVVPFLSLELARELSEFGAEISIEPQGNEIFTPAPAGGFLDYFF